MSYQIQRSVMIGFHVAVAAAAGACLPPPPGVACGDKWCPEQKLCALVGQDVGGQQLVCVAQGVCGNGIIEDGEACDCGDDGIVAPGAACGGQGNSNMRGLCRKDCKLHCGDEVLDADEECDAKLNVTESCVDLRYDFGRPRCSASCRIITDTCGAWNWQPMISSREVAQGLSSIWGSGINNIFAVGLTDKIMHYDGTTWQTTDFATGDSLISIWGSGPSNIFAVGDSTIMHYTDAWRAIESPTNQPLVSVWSSGPNDVFVASESRVIEHYDGTTWHGASGSAFLGANKHPKGIWGSGPDDVFVVGWVKNFISTTALIAHYDGHGWALMTAPDSRRLLGVWGSGPKDVFAVGEQGAVFHYNGIEWTAMASGSNEDLHGVSGTGPGDVFAVGDHGTILHYDGTQWQPMTSGSGAPLSSVWANTTSSDVLVTGTVGPVLHYAGSSWQRIDSGGSQTQTSIGNTITGIWGNSFSDIFAVGSGQILHYNGSEWTTVKQGIQPTLWDIWGCDPDHVFVAGGETANNNDGAVLRYDGDNLVQVAGSDSTPFLLSIWGSSCNDIFTVGANGTILHYDGNLWTQMESGTQKRLSRVWGSGPKDVYAVGGLGLNPFDQTNDVIILHYDGNRWLEILTDPGVPSLTDVWGSSPDDIFVVGDSGTVLHYNGNAWVSMNSGTRATLRRVWGTGADDVYAVGDVGVLLHYDGLGWLPMQSGAGASFQSIWGDLSSNTLIVSGSTGVFFDEGESVIYRMTRPPRR